MNLLALIMMFLPHQEVKLDEIFALDTLIINERVIRLDLVNVPSLVSPCKVEREQAIQFMGEAKSLFEGKKLKMTKDGPIVDGIMYRGWLLNKGYAMPFYGIGKRASIYCYVGG